LVAAATALFDERGYQAATIRDIAARAGVDAALIARYFGGKEGLYLAALAQEPEPTQALDPSSLVARLLDKSERRRHSPLTLAMVSPMLGESIREQVRPLIERRLTKPLVEWLTRAGARDPQLLGELLVASTVGISLTRSSGTLRTLSSASPTQIQRLLDPLTRNPDD
jgi:AcrR family transcriptional regulator